MTDKELLELAAKAAGYFDYPNDSLEMGTVWHTNRLKAPFDECFPKSSWNPLTDDGDALRLAVKLGLLIDTNYNGGVCAGSASLEEVWEPDGKDPYAATRRAIVRAAAEIGKGMK